MPTFVDVLAAAQRLRGVANYTPVLHSRRFDARVGCEVYFKAEHLQRTGSFKFRGAYNALVQLASSAQHYSTYQQSFVCPLMPRTSK